VRSVPQNKRWIKLSAVPRSGRNARFDLAFHRRERGSDSNRSNQVRNSDMTLMGKLMTGAGVLALSTGIAAAAPAMVQNDLNLRTGPGVQYPVVAAMPGGAAVDVMGCEGSWCRVAFNGTEGWASRAYMGIGGGVAATPGYAESYASGGYAPRYRYDADSYAYGNSGPGYYTYGYSGDAALQGRYSESEGGRTFGNERRFSEQSAVRGERRVGEETTIRRESRSSEQSATRGERRVGDDTRSRAPIRCSIPRTSRPRVRAATRVPRQAAMHAPPPAPAAARKTAARTSSDRARRT
jgi:uncharacterized protein YraI